MLYTPQNIDWCEPLDLAETINKKHWVLLYSAVKTSYSGRYSFLACDMCEQIVASDFAKFSEVLSNNQPCFDNAWFGYLAYDLKNCLEKYHKDEKNWLDLPLLCMMRFGKIYRFDHDSKTLILWSDQLANKMSASEPEKLPLPKVKNISSNMTDTEYLEKAAYVIEKNHAGDLYQANLTRKFYGEFEETPDAFQLFRKLCEVSPAPYSAFIRLDNSYILSSSPESFVNIDADGNIITRPIKGTAPRGKDKESDDKLREQLINSEKDKAENLMIVDLMRNDLAKCCETGSVNVASLFDLTTHATIHHLSSTITGKKRKDISTIEAIKSIFPAGSMTGAPKIRAINLCSELEKLERGVYSGAIGWFGGDGSCALSVVIRTLIIQDKKFEFQVGGGIVADSTPEKELEELINKAKGIMLTLGI